MNLVKTYGGKAGNSWKVVYVPLSNDDKQLSTVELARKYRIDHAKAYEAKGRGAWVNAAPALAQLNPFCFPFVSTKGGSEIAMTEHDDRPGYRLIAVIGRLAALEEIVERRWEAIAPNSEPAAAAEEIPTNFEHIVERFERAHIVAALERTGGNKSKAARLLGITPRILFWKIKTLGIGSESTQSSALSPQSSEGPAISLEREE